MATDPFLGAYARNIWLVSAKNDINLATIIDLAYGKQIKKVANLLSRWQNTQSQNIQPNAMVQSPIWLRISDDLL